MGNIRGTAGAGWLHLEEWMFTDSNFGEVASPDFIKQGRIFPSNYIPRELVDPWSSEGDLVRDTALNLGFAAHGNNETGFEEMLKLGTNRIIEGMRSHRKHYITADDFKEMKNEGLTVLRINVGWWAFYTYPLPKQEKIISDWYEYVFQGQPFSDVIDFVII